jgi:glutathione S-transferase
MILYEHPLSSYAQKVKIALREKGVAFERALPEDFGTGKRDTPFAAANPRTEVPALVLDDGAAIFESTVILEYLEERWPDPPLLPVDPLKRAVARMTEEICDTQYDAVNWGYGELLWFQRAEGALAERLKAAAVRDTQRLLEWLAERLGDAAWFAAPHSGGPTRRRRPWSTGPSITASALPKTPRSPAGVRGSGNGVPSL